MKNAWRILFGVGFVASLAVPGCVVGSSDDDDETGGSGGTSSGGTSSGGTSSGGTSTGGASTGGTSTGGTSTGGASTGGSGGFVCGATGSTPSGCEVANPTQCDTCVKAKCCTEYGACFGENPNDPCGWGAPGGEGEGPCFVECFKKEVANGKTEDEASNTCGANCTSPGCGTISDATNDLITCLKAECLADCLTN